ncbi:MAG: hypothetical protein IKM37_06175 [Alistipes sp.]|nr:hypothetical protein [Alistipes sp.]
MTTLITPQEVLQRGFAGIAPLSPEMVTSADILAAEERYLIPAIGPALHARLLQGNDASFVADYLAAPLALFTRLLIQPRLQLLTTRIGVLEPSTDQGSAAKTASLNRLQQSLRSEASTLLRRAIRYLEAHASEYPEYDPHQNILNRCTIHGNHLQIH